MELHLLKRDSPPNGIAEIVSKILDDAFDRSRIRCPKCDWQPGPTSLWSCVDNPHPEAFLSGCGRAWNTFETSGTCPGCSHQWEWTACLVCAQWSLHDEWYDDEPDQ